MPGWIGPWELLILLLVVLLVFGPKRLPEAGRALGKVTNHVFLGNISEYYAALPSGQVLRVQTHPLERFEVGYDVALEIDAKSCSVFRRTSAAEPASS